MNYKNTKQDARPVRQDEFQSIVGMKTEDAVIFARSKGVAVRIAREDDKAVITTRDYISDRINLEVKKGKVVKFFRG